MRLIILSYTIILGLGIGAFVTGVHFLANIGGFLSAIGLMAIFFKDRPENETEYDRKIRKYWYIVFATGIIFSLIFGSLWNTHMGNMEVR